MSKVEKKVQISDDSYDPFGTITLNCFNFNKTKLYWFKFSALHSLPSNSITIFVQITNCIFQNYSHAMSFYGIKFLAGTGQSSFFLALLTLRQSMNAFCSASFMIGSQICFNFWVKLAALLWQLRQELFQPFLAVLPLRP